VTFAALREIGGHGAISKATEDEDFSRHGER
jgi:hypothetical protein